MKEITESEYKYWLSSGYSILDEGFSFTSFIGVHEYDTFLNVEGVKVKLTWWNDYDNHSIIHYSRESCEVLPNQCGDGI
jgi:hypothetical protein